MDESVLRPPDGIGIAQMNGWLVAERKPLSLLLSADEPVSQTKNGEPNHFDTAVIRSPAGSLPEELQRQL